MIQLLRGDAPSVRKPPPGPLLSDRPGATCREIPRALIDEIVSALGIPPHRLDVHRSGIAILAEDRQ